MKNGISGTGAGILVSIEVIVITWLTFFTRLYDGPEYLWAMVITAVFLGFLIMCLIDSKWWDA